MVRPGVAPEDAWSLRARRPYNNYQGAHCYPGQIYALDAPPGSRALAAENDLG